MKLLIVGGGDIAETGIKPLFDDVFILPYDASDVSNYDDVAMPISARKPDVVICTAGVSHVANLQDSSPKDWRHEIEVNLIGSYNVAKATITYNPNATMIFMASVAGMYGKPEHSGYSASKAGVISLVQSLGMEGYNAYAISPGRVDTKMRERDFPNEDPKTRLPAREVGRVVKEILDGRHEPGDNLVIRKRGYRTLRRVDKGMPWREYLAVGKPPVV